MIRVAIVTPYPSTQRGGITTFARGVKEAIEARLGGECAILAPRTPASLYCHPLATMLSFAAIFLRLVSARPRAIFVQAHPLLLLPAIAHARLASACSIVFTFHTAPEPGQLRGLKAKVASQLLSRCAALTFVSRYLLEQVSPLLSPSSVPQQVVYPGVAVPRSPPEEERKVEALAQGRTPVLTFVGTMAWEAKVEGIKILLRSLTEIRRHWPQVLLLIAGSGEREDSVKAFAREIGVAESVAFLGRVSSPEACLSRSHAYVHVSMKESLSQATLEAMALGLPVIASDTGGLREIIDSGRTGLLVSPHPDEVSRAVLRVLGDPALAAALAAAGRRLVLENLSWTKTAHRLLQIAGVSASDASDVAADSKRSVPSWSP